MEAHIYSFVSGVTIVDLNQPHGSSIATQMINEDYADQIKETYCSVADNKEREVVISNCQKTIKSLLTKQYVYKRSNLSI